MNRILSTSRSRVVFDIGANVGQSAKRYCELFPHADIHSFEPDPRTFDVLQRNCLSDHRVHCHRAALSNTVGQTLRWSAIQFILVEAGIIPVTNTHINAIDALMSKFGYWPVGFYDQMNERPIQQHHLRRTDVLHCSTSLIGEQREVSSSDV